MVDHVASQTMVMVARVSVVFGAAGYLLAPGLLALLVWRHPARSPR